MDHEQKHRIPRYLGLNRASSKDGSINIELGYSEQLRQIISTDADGLKLIEACLAPKTLRQLQSETGLPKTHLRQALKALNKAGVIKPVSQVPKKFVRYDRHLLFYDLQGADAVLAQSKISKARIALIGMGGIGSWVSLGLIGAGFKELKLIDFDVVELSNLTRQVLFTEKNIGQRKTEAAAATLRERNCQTKITPIDLQVTSAQELHRYLLGMDFVVVSADRPALIHDWVDEVCIDLDIPYLNLGYRDGRGIVGPLTVKNKTSCYQCFKPKPFAKTPQLGDLEQKFESRYQAPSFGPLNAIVSATGVLEVIKAVSGIGNCRSLGVELEIDPVSLQTLERAYHRCTDCWHCGAQA